jgi:hypothetical protein
MLDFKSVALTFSPDAARGRAQAGPLTSELMGWLPVSGVDGTLTDSHLIPGQADLKTGTLRDASASPVTCSRIPGAATSSSPTTPTRTRRDLRSTRWSCGRP